MPPGTGDVAISLGQLLPRAEAVLVTTPQPAAQEVAIRAGTMARKTNMRLLGVVENMSGDVFGIGGGDRLADELGFPVFGSIPLDPRIRECADAGEPIVWSDPESPASQTILAHRPAIEGTKRELGVGIVKALPVLSVPRRPSAAGSSTSSRRRACSRTSASADAFLDVSARALRPGGRPRGGIEDRAILTKRPTRVWALVLVAAGDHGRDARPARLEPGHRVLEIGAGTRYNAALLQRIVGEEGRVSTVDIDPARWRARASGSEGDPRPGRDRRRPRGLCAGRAVRPASSSPPARPDASRARGWSNSPGGASGSAAAVA